MYQTQYLANPCRNFHILASAGFTDPKDGIVKIAMLSYADYALGTLYLIDPRTRAVEQYTLPLDCGGWAIRNWRDEAIIIGTCEQYGCVHKFDLKTRTYAEPLRIDGETYIWNFAQGTDGCFYGGTYNGCKLLKYDPAAHTLTDLGRVDPNEKNLYARHVAAKDGYILVDAGMSENRTFAYCIADGTCRPAGEIGIDQTALSLLNAENPCGTYGTRLPDGSFVQIKGQQYLFRETESAAPAAYRIPGEAPASGIFSLEYDGAGGLWGTTAFGMTMFRYDLGTGTYQNTSDTTYKGGGEIYGLVHTNDKFYMTSYSAGFHIVYDPAKPFESDINPRVIHCAGPAYNRPHARSVIGPKGDIWTGWYAQYGTYGGALTKMDIKTEEVTVYPVGNRAVAGIAANDTHVFYATQGNGNGLPTLKEAFRLAKVDSDGQEVQSLTLPDDLTPDSLYLFGKELYLCAREMCIVYDTDDLSVVCEMEMPFCQAMVRYGDELLAFGGKKVYAVDPATHACTVVAETTFPVFMARTVGDTVYYSCGIELWKLTKE